MDDFHLIPRDPYHKGMTAWCHWFATRQRNLIKKILVYSLRYIESMTSSECVLLKKYFWGCSQGRSSIQEWCICIFDRTLCIQHMQCQKLNELNVVREKDVSSLKFPHIDRQQARAVSVKLLGTLRCMSLRCPSLLQMVQVLGHGFYFSLFKHMPSPLILYSFSIWRFSLITVQLFIPPYLHVCRNKCVLKPIVA